MPAASNPLPDWQRAFGGPIFQGLIKQTPSDFKVTEVLGFAPSGDGEHDFLWIEKSGANTVWVARARWQSTRTSLTVTLATQV